jgi:hypothetical protein
MPSWPRPHQCTAVTLLWRHLRVLLEGAVGDVASRTALPVHASMHAVAPSSNMAVMHVRLLRESCGMIGQS